MKQILRSAVLTGCILVWATGALAQADYHYVHLAVPSPAEAVRWYDQYMECQPMADRPDAIDCGRVEIIFETGTTVGASPGTGIDHIAFSYADVTARMQELERVGVGGRGVRLQRFDDGATLAAVPGLFTHGFVFDPWGTRIELLEDPDTTGFHHVHLSSADPEVTLEWYQDAFGGERSSLNGQLEGLLFDEVWLIVSAHPDGTPAATEGRAIDHLGFLVADIDEAAAIKKAIQGAKASIKDFAAKAAIELISIGANPSTVAKRANTDLVSAPNANKVQFNKTAVNIMAKSDLPLADGEPAPLKAIEALSGKADA